MKRILVLAAAVLVAVTLTVPAALGAQSTPSRSPSADHVSDGITRSDHRLAGTWVYDVHLGAPPGQPTPPPFEATFVYTADGSIIETTSRVGNVSAGLGVWRKIGPSTYRTMFYKYRFDATGAYVGKTVIREKLVLSSRRHVTSTSTTRVYDAGGDLLTRIENTADGKRLTLG